MKTITKDDFGDDTLKLFLEAKETGKYEEFAKALIDSDFPINEIRIFLKKELKVKYKDFDYIVKLHL